DVAPKVQVGEERALVIGRRRANGDLAAVAVLVDGARAAVWTREQVGHRVVAPSGSWDGRPNARSVAVSRAGLSVEEPTQAAQRSTSLREDGKPPKTLRTRGGRGQY